MFQTISFDVKRVKKHVSATCVLPTITTLLRGLQRIMSLWDVMFQKLQLFCFWTLAHKIFRACSPPEGLSKNIKLWGGGPLNFWEIWTKVQNIKPHISSTKGIRGPILVWGDVGITGLLKFQNWGTWPPPPIFGEFLPQFSHLPKILQTVAIDFFLTLHVARGPWVAYPAKIIKIWPPGFFAMGPQSDTSHFRCLLYTSPSPRD